MTGFKISLLGLLYIFISLGLGLKCPEDATSKLVVCYFEGESSVTDLSICNCTHVIFTNAVRKIENDSISATEGTLRYLDIFKEQKKNLTTIFTLETKQDETSTVLKSENKSEQLINSIDNFLQESQFDGVELDIKFSSDDGITKELYASFVKKLSKTLSSRHLRVKRNGYDVFEKLQDDITTAAYTTQTPKNSTTKTHSIKQGSRKSKENNRKVREEKNENETDEDFLTLEEAINAEFSQEKQNSLKDVEDDVFEERKSLIFVRLSIQPEIVAKKYDLKSLSRYADILTVPTHNIMNMNEEHLTYHPSRLMGLSDILNTDSILDFLTGMGGLKSKMVISLPAGVLKFQLKDEKKNTPRSLTASKPEMINQSQLCRLFSKNNWTLERDDDLTAPYAFSGKTWLAFEDEISVNIKGKYILLRELAGGAIYPIDFDLNDGSCINRTKSGGYLTGILHKNFKSLERKPRALVLESLQEEIHENGFTNVKAGVQVSEYRIVRVVDHSGAVHVIRKNTKTQFECSRQGYFSHPLGCNKFYRCVKFDQYSNDFTVFEYDCPSGLAFDERWEVCVWPGSLPHGAPCTGSSEIAPVPRSHYKCPNHEGYFADPENCRWFFACLDHAQDGITPLTAYEFRCPFGLVFSEEKLACDWPWLVGSCGNRGAAGYLNINAAGQSQGIQTATFINGGNLEASLGQYNYLDQSASFIDFGKKFGNVLKESAGYSEKNTYQGAQSAGYEYIASQFDENRDKASFASFPDYQISGGRILNKGGVVLDQNIAGISSGGVGSISGALDEMSIRQSTASESKSFDRGTGQTLQKIIHSGIHITPQIKYQRIEPAVTTTKTNTLETSEVSLGEKISLFTPKPFSVHIPSVQINEGHSEHSTVGSTTPKSLIFAETPKFENIENVNIQLQNVNHVTEKQYSTPRGFTVSQPKPAVSLTLPLATPTPEIHTFGQVISEGFDAAHLKPDKPLNGINFEAISNTKVHKVEQTNLKENEFFNKISANQPSVAAGIPVATQSFGYNLGASGVKEEVSVSVPLVTPKPNVHTFQYTARGHTVDISRPFVSTQSPADFTQSHKITNQNSETKGLGKSVLSVNIPSNIATIQTHTFTNNNEQNLITGNVATGQNGIPLIAVTPSIINGIESGTRLSAASSAFAQSSIDQKVTNELKFNKPQNAFAVPTVIPKTPSENHSRQFVGNLVSEKISLVTPKPDFQIFSQTGLTSNGDSGSSPVTVSYDVPVVTPQAELGFSGYYGKHVTTPVAPFQPLGVTSAIENSFRQTGTAEVLKNDLRVSYNTPVTTPPSNINSFEVSDSLQQKRISSETKKFYNIPTVAPEITNNVQTQQISHGFYKPASDIKFSRVATPIQPAFGQRYSYSSSFKQSGNQFGSIQPFGGSTPKPVFIERTQVFVPKNEDSKILTEVTVEQQPIVSVGTISSIASDQTLSTPKPFSHDFSKTSGLNNNVKSTFAHPQAFTVTTPSPTLVTPSTNAIYEHRFGYSGANIVESPRTITFNNGKINGETNSPAIQETIVSLSEKLNLDQKSFAPFVQVTTSIPKTYNQDIVSGKSAFYDKSIDSLPPFQQNSHVSSVQYGTTVRNQVLHQEEPSKPVVNQYIESLKTKPFIEEKKEFALHQQPVQITTVTPLYQESFSPAVATGEPFTPREQLVGLEITKSVEVNPSEFFQSAEERLPVKSTETQQQSLDLTSQRTFPARQQSFYQGQGKQIIFTQSNKFPENNYQEQFEFQQQQTNFNSPSTKILEQKQYLLPTVTSGPQINSYDTAKAINVEQPFIYSKDGASAFPSFEASKISLVDKTEAKHYLAPSGFVKYSSKSASLEESNKQHPTLVSRFNILEPTSTEIPQYTASLSEESTVQAHRNFDSKKINTYGTTPLQSVFIQPETHSTLKPAVNIFQTSGQLFRYNFTTGDGHSSFGSGIKYAVNPNIEIPEPPKEYILAGNGYTTIAPEISTINKVTNELHLTSTDSFRSRFEGSTYPPLQASSYKKPSEATLISVGSLNEGEINDDNVQQLFEKYSGRFGQVINSGNEKFVKKIISGQEKEGIEVNKDGPSTVRYELSSTTPRQRTRGRLYHGDITSGRQATNKYEEYEINGGTNGQVNLEIEEEGRGSKTTIDLKNLKVDKNKKTVIVVSQVSDANPVLIGKLAGQCSCQSNMLELRTKGKKSKGSFRKKNKNSPSQQHSAISNEYLPPYEGSQSKIETETLTRGGGVLVAPETVVIGGAKFPKEEITYTEQNSISSSTAQPDFVSSTILSTSVGHDEILSITPKTLLTDERIRSKSKQFRGRARYLPPSSLLSEDGSSAPLLSSVPASEIASTFDYSVLKGDEIKTQNEIYGGKSEGNAGLGAGAAFDRYGPGGWRGFDETLQGSIDCKRPGLFRHPKHCNKFYACNYDPWKERFTLHVFNCPIHLTYDSSISACNWPVRGPACADDNLLV